MKKSFNIPGWELGKKTRCFERNYCLLLDFGKIDIKLIVVCHFHYHFDNLLSFFFQSKLLTRVL